MFNEIVRDVTRTEQAKTVTPDYQSPGGIGDLLSGLGRGLMGLTDDAQKGGKRGGSGSDKDLASAYDYVRQQVNDLDSRSTGPSEKQKIYDDTWVNAVRMFGVDDSDMKSIYDATGMQKYGEEPKALRESFVDAEILQKKQALNVGRAALPNGSLDDQMQMGSIEIAKVSNGEMAIRAASVLTPEQQQKIFGNDSQDNVLKGSLKDAITLSWNAQYRNAQLESVPEEAVLESFKNQWTSQLAQEGIDQVVARSVVEDALLPQQIQIYGEEYLKNTKGLEYLRDKSFKALDTTNKIQQADQVSQIMNMKFEGLTDPKGTQLGTLSGRQLFAIVGADGSDGSISALASKLDPANFRIVFNQMAKQTKDRWTWRQMRLVLSEQGAMMSQIMADNPTASQSIAEGVQAGTESLIGDFNNMSTQEKAVKNAYWIPAQKFIDSYTLPTGSLQSKDVVDVGYNPEMKEQAKQNFFKMIQIGTDSATTTDEGGLIKTMAGGFFQIDEHGKVRYYGLSSNRIQNLARLSPGSGLQARTLKDLTDVGRVINSFDMDSVRMREGIPVVERGLKILEESFGYDRAALVEEFNNYQIQNTIGGQRARSIQLLDQTGEGSRFIDRSTTMQMSPEDIKAVRDQIKSGKLEYATTSMGPDTAQAINKEIPEIALGTVEQVGEFLKEGLKESKEATEKAVDYIWRVKGDRDITVKPISDGFVVDEQTPKGLVTHFIKSDEISEDTAKEAVYEATNMMMKDITLEVAKSTLRKIVNPVSSSRELPANVSGFELPDEDSPLAGLPSKRDLDKLDKDVEEHKDSLVYKRLYGENWYEEYQAQKANRPAETQEAYINVLRQQLERIEDRINEKARPSERDNKDWREAREALRKAEKAYYELHKEYYDEDSKRYIKD